MKISNMTLLAGTMTTDILYSSRIVQIRWCSRAIRSLSRMPLLFRIIKALREWPLFAGLLGYNRPFARLEDAEAAIVCYNKPGHEDANHLNFLMTQPLRPSDYPALFHIQSFLSQVHTVFDFGGNAGNLFYNYSEYLRMPSDLIWTVYDLPENIAIGFALAKQRQEMRLRFTDDLVHVDGSDLFIASGSLHYFEKPLIQILADCKKKPRYILINRTPLTNDPSFATVQDSNGMLVGCKLYNRDTLIQGLERMNYTLVDSWQVAELSLIIPGYPDKSAPAYSGLLFKFDMGEFDEALKLMKATKEKLLCNR